MLKFDVGNNRFNYRSAAVIVHDDHVLLTRSEKDAFWALPGGRVEFFEFSEDTIPREIFEELNLEASVKRLLWHIENFFEYAGKNFHEISNYFLTELSDPQEISMEVDFPGIEEELELIFRWVPVSKLSEYALKPNFLKMSIQNMPLTVEFIKYNELGT